LIINKYIDQVTVSELTSWTGYPRSSWYYRPTNGSRGIPASTHTRKRDGTYVSNQEVLEDIRKVLSSGLDFYGYEKTTWELHDLDYNINKKKVYRLMKEANLLLIKQRVSTQGQRQFVQFRTIDAQHPLEYLAMDIKYVFIDEEQRFAYLLTVLDICTRFELGHTLKNSIRKADVVLLLDGILQGVPAKGIIIRSDNGKQFLAHNVRKYLKGMGVVQEFTHIATPEDNGYIEAHFSNLSREFLKRNWLDSLYHARIKINDYYRIYNYRRKQKALGRRSPYQYIKTFFPEFADKHPFAFSSSLSRVALEDGSDSGATCLALDKEMTENASFVQSVNQDFLQN
jgi:transposase InsO family protein